MKNLSLALLLVFPFREQILNIINRQILGISD